MAPRGSVDATADKDVHWLLRAQAERRPDATFVAWEPFASTPRAWSYATFLEDVRRVAAGLAGRKLGRGDTLLLHANNCPEFLILWHACAALGIVVVTTNPRVGAGELAYFVEHSRPRAIVIERALAGQLAAAAHHAEWIAVIDTDAESDGDPPAAAIAFAELAAGQPGPGLTLGGHDPLRPLSVQYTSGTTALPKGVVWTHANALWGGQVGAAHNLLRPDDAALVFTPLCHTNAMSWAHFPILWSGSKLVLQPSFSARRFWPAALKHGCTWGNVIPFAVKAIAAHPVPPDHRYRHWNVGAANIGPIEKLLRVSIVGAWGMTETITHGTYTPPHLPSPPLSMGMPVPEFELTIVDPADKPVAPGEVGLLKIRGERGRALFLEYLHDPDATANSFDAEGWFDTGDRVFMMANGHLRFADRAKDMLKVGAENVAASEIEGVIAPTLGVLEVAVVGRPHPMLDEVPVAFVRAERPSDELRDAILAACRATLASFKVPAAIVFVDDFPRAELNKVAKQGLRDLARTTDQPQETAA